MKIIDYNGGESWSRDEVLSRYTSYAESLRITPIDISPDAHEEQGCRWIYPVMRNVIDGIEAGDPACTKIGIEFISEDRKFTFGRILKSATARALRRTELTEFQKQMIRNHVFNMLRRSFTPGEFREYAKLVRKIGFDASELEGIKPTNPFTARYLAYFEMAARQKIG